MSASPLDALRRSFETYAVLPSPEALDATVLWVAATHAQGCWNTATRLVITAPEKRCGKSRLMDVIEATCSRPLMSVNISPAALVRSIGAEPVTLMIDEADTVFKRGGGGNEALRGILNAGHQRNRPYIRWQGNAREDVPTFCMAALAGIGDPPDTITDRAVVVRMRRRRADEHVSPFRIGRDDVALHALREEIAEWATKHADELAVAEPRLPVEDRAADNWHALVSIADAAGGDWPRRARKAAITLTAQQDEEATSGSVGTLLLRDLRSLFGSETFLSTAAILAMLAESAEGPWSDMQLTPRALSDLLRPYGVTPSSTGQERGYKRAAFADAWGRYLPTDGLTVLTGE